MPRKKAEPATPVETTTLEPITDDTAVLSPDSASGEETDSVLVPEQEANMPQQTMDESVLDSADGSTGTEGEVAMNNMDMNEMSNADYADGLAPEKAYGTTGVAAEESSGIPEVEIEEFDDQAFAGSDEQDTEGFASDLPTHGANDTGLHETHDVSGASASSTTNHGIESANDVGSTEQSARPLARARRTNRPKQPPEAPVLTLRVGDAIEGRQEKEGAIWHELKNSQVSGTPLSGMFARIETLEGGSVIAVIDYQGQRVAIPLEEMMIRLPRPNGQSDEVYNARVVQVLNGMLGAEIDFVTRGVDARAKAAIASRKQAMLRLRRRYYFSDTPAREPQVRPDRIVEARVIAVGERAVRVEVFGVETSIRSEDLSWEALGDARDHYFVGEEVHVRVTKVSGDTPESLSIKADIRSLSPDTTAEKFSALKLQTNSIGTVTDVVNGIIFLRLTDGVRAIAHTCRDPKDRKPGRGDDVVFVATRKDEERHQAIGIVSRIVKRRI